MKWTGRFEADSTPRQKAEEIYKAHLDLYGKDPVPAGRDLADQCKICRNSVLVRQYIYRYSSNNFGHASCIDEIFPADERSDSGTQLDFSGAMLDSLLEMRDEIAKISDSTSNTDKQLYNMGKNQLVSMNKVSGEVSGLRRDVSDLKEAMSAQNEKLSKFILLASQVNNVTPIKTDLPGNGNYHPDKAEIAQAFKDRGIRVKQ